MPMAWFTLIFGGIILLIGLAGQMFATRKGHPVHHEDRHAGRIVMRVASTVAGLWLVAFSAVHLLHLHSTGHW
ncbi:hypothetical protein [Silvibacterium acidisoli]|uniref:hypothetical protein n=1 Tax=Acidobacteriaceae bacterium ZG23-2 TaxID=2883246 RepID=UPI00406C8E1E